MFSKNTANGVIGDSRLLPPWLLDCIAVFSTIFFVADDG